MASLWKFCGSYGSTNWMVDGHQLSHHKSWSSHFRESSSKAPLEHREVWANHNVHPAREDQIARMEGSNGDSDVEFQDSREVLHPGTFADSIAVPRSVPITSVTNTASSSTRLTNTLVIILSLQNLFRFLTQISAQVLSVQLILLRMQSSIRTLLKGDLLANYCDLLSFVPNCISYSCN